MVVFFVVVLFGCLVSCYVCLLSFLLVLGLLVSFVCVLSFVFWFSVVLVFRLVVSVV